MVKIIDYLKKIRKELKLYLNKINAKKNFNKLKSKDFTIISNNCFAGITYEYLGLPFSSPTIGLYFFAPEYIKFIKRIKYYTSLKLKKIEVEQSKYFIELKNTNQLNVVIGKLDDVEIVFLHYNSFKEAKEKWEKRCERINYKKIIYKFNDQNLCTEKELKEFNELKFKNKLCFTAKKYNYENFIQITKDKNKKNVKDDGFGYHKYLNIVKYINSIK